MLSAPWCSAAQCMMSRLWKRQSGTYTLCIEGMAVGFGARPFADGIDAVYYVAQKNYPVEFAEMEFGVRIERYSMHRDSGGPGTYRGGCGVIRDIRIIADEGILASRLENVTYPAWGVNGGHSGRPGRLIVNPGMPDERELKPLSDNNCLRQGDLLRMLTPGGGWGDPLERDPARVRDDVLDGFVSLESALVDYGVVLDPKTLEVDEAATHQRRRNTPRQTAMFHRGKYHRKKANEALTGETRW